MKQVMVVTAFLPARLSELWADVCEIAAMAGDVAALQAAASAPLKPRKERIASRRFIEPGGYARSDCNRIYGVAGERNNHVPAKKPAIEAWCVAIWRRWTRLKPALVKR